MTVILLLGDCREKLLELPEQYFHTVITSPPYFGLRDYGVDGQVGLEDTADEFIAELVRIFRLVHRVLRDDGTLWLNLGDSYRNKRLQGIPWRVALALQDDGWLLRSEIIFSKPNPMPEAPLDRPTRSHEQLFLLSKFSRYFYDAQAVREDRVTTVSAKFRSSARYLNQPSRGTANSDHAGDVSATQENIVGRNKRTVWTIATEPFKGGHFAAFPTKLVEPCILAGTSEYGCCSECGKPAERIVERVNLDAGPKPQAMQLVNAAMAETVGRKSAVHISHGDGQSTLGTVTEYRTTGWRSCPAHPSGRVTKCRVLDPFSGAGTTSVVAERLNRDSVGIELSADYCALAQERILTDEKLVHWPTVSVE